MATSGLPGISVGLGVDATGVTTGLRVADQQFKQFGSSVTRSNGQMRAGFQQVSFQVQDFVVQVSSGTNAMRAFAQQAPQLLSAFGPGGAVIGTVVAIVAGLGAAFLGAGKSAAAAADGIGDFKVSLDQTIETVDDAIKSFREMGEAQRLAVESQLVDQLFAGDAALADLSSQLRDTARDFGAVGAAEAGLIKGTGELSVLIAKFEQGLIGPQRFAAEVRDLADVVGDADFSAFASEVGQLGREFASTELGMEQTRRRLHALDQVARGHTQTTEELADAEEERQKGLDKAAKSTNALAAASRELTDAQKRLGEAGKIMLETSAKEERAFEETEARMLAMESFAQTSERKGKDMLPPVAEAKRSAAEMGQVLEGVFDNPALDFDNQAAAAAVLEEILK